jgi:hypothetical protein
MRPAERLPPWADPLLVGDEILALLAHVRPTTQFGAESLAAAKEKVKQLAWGPGVS